MNALLHSLRFLPADAWPPYLAACSDRSFGGAAGPIAFDGKLVLSSGYGIYNHMPGNLLLVLGK